MYSFEGFFAIAGCGSLIAVQLQIIIRHKKRKMAAWDTGQYSFECRYVGAAI